MTDATQTMLTMQIIQKMDDQSNLYHIEVENGKVMQVAHNVVGLQTPAIQNLFLILQSFSEQAQLGDVFVDGKRYILSGDADNIHCAYHPALSFLRAGRIPDDFKSEGDFMGAPDFVVEVASRGQGTAYYVKRMANYFEAGVEEIWFIVPWDRVLYQYCSDAEAPKTFAEQDTFAPSALFPNLQIPIASLFNTDA